jgi:hypothetical protein
MALSTYSELKSSLADWKHRSGLTGVTPDFIRLTEADVNRRVRVATMETRASATFDEGYEDLPSDFLELREVKVNSSPVRSLMYLTPQQMTEFYPTLETGNPDYYTITGSQIRLNRTPTSEVEIAYYVAIPALSDDNTTNWLLTNHPDVYLNGSMFYAETYVMNDKRAMGWKALYEIALKQVEDADKRARWSAGPLQIRVSWQ